METTTTRRSAALLLTIGLLTSCGGDGAGTGTDVNANPAPTTSHDGGTTSHGTADGDGTTGSTASNTASDDTATDDTATDDTDTDDDSTSSATDDSTGADSADAGAVTMTISGFAFQVPATVAPGEEITVTNEDTVGHTVTSDDDGATFDVAVGAGETVTFTAPDEPGEYGFFCRPHPNMTGTLVVEG